MFCKCLISILLSKLTHEKAEKFEMKKFSGREDVTSSFPKGKAKSRHVRPKRSTS